MIVEELLTLKAKYFGSQFFNLNSWLKFNAIKLPHNLTVLDIEGWAEEKQYYLAKSNVAMDGIQKYYQKMLIDRLDYAAALQMRVATLIEGLKTPRETGEVARALKNIADIQDSAMEKLKIDAYKANLYEMNKVSTESLLKDSESQAAPEPKRKVLTPRIRLEEAEEE